MHGHRCPSELARPLVRRADGRSPSCGRLQFRSGGYLRALARLQKFARAGTVPILLEGESGTGKTQHASYVHRQSERAEGPFQIAILSAIADGFAASELFGHVAGAFTDARQSRPGLFASAAGGTLFLDEIGKSSRSVQQLLLHVVEYGEMRPLGSDRVVRTDARVVSASNKPLSRLVAEDRFLPDLHARLANFRVELPPLRDRRADIPILVEEYVSRHAYGYGYATEPAVHPELMTALEGAPWPNNLRELDATIQRLLIDADGASVLTTDLCVGDLAHLRQRGKPKPGTLCRADVDRAIATAGDVSKAARLLEVDRSTVYRILQRRRADATPDSCN
jgi:DNA-binding NtrC family response regulator